MAYDPNDLPPGYAPVEYPKMKFHVKHGQRVVADLGEERKLGKGWFDTEAELNASRSKPTPEKDDEPEKDVDNEPPLNGDGPPLNPAFPKRDDGGDLDPTIVSVNT